MLIAVVDTNVLLVADGLHDAASPQCLATAARRLRTLTRGGVVVIDDRWRIIGQYKRKLSTERGSGVQPKAGSRFLQWLLENHAYNRRRVNMRPVVEHDTRGFSEFPEDPRLMRFDPDDRVFVAVALAYAPHPPVLNAADRDWWEYRDALANHGLEVDFICPELMTRSRTKG